jgi:hypothetical protein
MLPVGGAPAGRWPIPPPRPRRLRPTTPHDRDRQRRTVQVFAVRGVHYRPPRAAPRPHPRPTARAGRLPRTRLRIAENRSTWSSKKWMTSSTSLLTPRTTGLTTPPSASTRPSPESDLTTSTPAPPTPSSPTSSKRLPLPTTSRRPRQPAPAHLRTELVKRRGQHTHTTSLPLKRAPPPHYPPHHRTPIGGARLS